MGLLFKLLPQQPMKSKDLTGCGPEQDVDFRIAKSWIQDVGGFRLDEGLYTGFPTMLTVSKQQPRTFLSSSVDPVACICDLFRTNHCQTRFDNFLHLVLEIRAMLLFDLQIYCHLFGKK